MTLKKAHKEKEDNLKNHNLAENNFSLKFPSQQDNKLTSVCIHLVPSHSSFFSSAGFAVDDLARMALQLQSQGYNTAIALLSP